MHAKLMSDALSRRAPMIVIGTFCAALLLYWTQAPSWIPFGLAMVIGAFALVVMATRPRASSHVTSGDEEGAGSERSWIAHELAGNGSPAGFYLLIFFGLVTIVLTGLDSAYALPSWAGLALGAAWGIARARYPADAGSQSYDG